MVERGLRDGSIVNLNVLKDAESLAGALHGVEPVGDRPFVASLIVRGS